MKNTKISTNFLVWKFCGNAQFSQSFWFGGNYAFQQNFHTRKFVKFSKFYAVLDVMTHFRKSDNINLLARIKYFNKTVFKAALVNIVIRISYVSSLIMFRTFLPSSLEFSSASRLWKCIYLCCTLISVFWTETVLV